MCDITKYNKLMIRQSIEKVGKLLRDRNYSVPEYLYKFYAFALYFAQRLDVQDADYNAIALFAEIHRLFKAYLVDEPFRLTKLTIPTLLKDREGISELSAIRDRFLKQFPILMPKETFIKEIITELSNLSWIQRLQSPLQQSLDIKIGLQSKKEEGVKHSQLNILFWYRQLKGDYLVPINNFIQSFITFSKQFLPALSFLNRFSSHCLKQLADPQHKNFVTIINCEDLLLKVRDPTVLQRLWQETQQSKEQQSFISQHKLRLKLLQAADSSLLQLFQASGEKLKTQDGQKPVQNKSAIFIGSAADNDIVIKSKYVSRKQVMIIEDRRPQKPKQGEARNFSAVCLSQTNFTSVKYPNPFKLHIGDIFYCGKVKYQLLRFQKQSIELEQNEEQDERTLTMLPGEREVGVLPNCEKATFLILSGEDKEKQFSASSQTIRKLTQMDQKHEFAVSQQLTYDQHFYLKIGTKVLLKSANQILENRLSKKVRLMSGMQIFLQEFILMVE